MARVAPYAIFFLSGVAGLGYQIVWTRMLSLGLGHEMPSLLAVVAAFFGGLAIGAWGLDGRVSRSATPARWYAALEVVIGAWATATVVLIPWLNRMAAEWIPVDAHPVRHWLVAFAIPFVALLPATAAMGATLPAMERAVARLRRSTTTVAGIYATNTAGAVAGTLLSTFVVIPALGYGATVVGLAAVNFLCAIWMWMGPGRNEAGRRPIATNEATHRGGDVRASTVIFATGLLGIGFELLSVRVMAQILENTIFSFASALSVYLVGTAVGAAIYQRHESRLRGDGVLAVLLQMLALSCLLAVLVLRSSSLIYESVRASLGAGFTASIVAEMSLAVAVFALPTALMGATFSHLAQAARRRSGGVGRALGLNTIGGALASLVFGVLLLPWLGARWTLVVVAMGYLLLVPWRLVKSARLAPVFGIAVLIWPVVHGDLLLVSPPPGGRIVAHRDGVMATVVVTESADGTDRRLKVNNRFSMGGTGTAFAERRQAHIPLLLHPGPRTALFLGAGTGITASAASRHPGVDVVAVELLPEVLAVRGWFTSDSVDEPGFRDTGAVRGLDPNGVDFRRADARRFVRVTEDRFDVIVADFFHPARDGSGALYTVEHFRAIDRRLAESGLFCQWLPLHQLDLETTRIIVRTFLAVFPEAVAVMMHFNVDTPGIGLLGSRQPLRFTPEWLRDRLGDAVLQRELVETALTREVDLFGGLMAASTDLAAFGGTGPINRDDCPIVTFRAPRLAYRKDEPPHARLAALLATWSPRAPQILRAPVSEADRAFATRLDRYLSARDHFLLANAARLDGNREQGLEHLLESVRASGDFRIAYLVLLDLATDEAIHDPARGRQLLEALLDARPADRRASDALRRIFGG